MTMTREEHLAWCKTRALEYLAIGQLQEAVVSMNSDLSKHPETASNPYLTLLGAMYATERDHVGVRRWIEGFR